MGSGLNKTKRRIASVKATEKITKAMEMIASVKMKRSRDQFDASSLSKSKCMDILSSAFASVKKTPYFCLPNEGNKTLYIIISSDLGLCGGYNSNVFKLFDPEYKEDDEIIAFGSKAISHYDEKKGYKISSLLKTPSLDISLFELTKLASLLLQEYKKNRFGSIKIISTRYVNSLNFVASSTTLLPISIPTYENEYGGVPPLIEPSPEAVINSIIPLSLGSILKEAIDEAKLCEQSSRRNAMDNANDNADELLKNLNIEYNKSRQSSITQEIVEVVSGSLN